jgi:hypothetical protein
MFTSTYLNIDRLNVAVEPRKGTWAESAISFVVVAAIVAYWIRFVDGCMISRQREKQVSFTENDTSSIYTDHYLRSILRLIAPNINYCATEV